ncbi:sirohydrochlorin cobaltochelatase [Desulfohalovibrio reitneri]|uniref:sirohydrochlorin cobaltochelatase n=1 Tax=Desulfohalovibrio reitneri TaxID=1307759 RepID=UPI0004A77B26|nr:sirohydrochlorin cobaltochelatase [Desulfohalovibrio reitneri]
MLFRTRSFLFILAALLCLAAHPAQAGHGHDRPDKTGILLVAFGTSIPEAQTVFDTIDQRVRNAHPGTPVRWAFTSSIIRDKIERTQGENLDSVQQALADMADQGFTRVAVQSLHTIPGQEFHDLRATIGAFDGLPGGLEDVSLGMPLLSSDSDLRRVADALLANLPGERSGSEAAVFMGHGTHHPANVYYPGLQYYLWERDPLAFVGVVEGAPPLNEVETKLAERGVERVWLLPFMSVAGDHARNDMAGDEPGSWKSVLRDKGYEVEVVLTGTAAYDQVVNVWLDHLHTALERLPR